MCNHTIFLRITRIRVVKLFVIILLASSCSVVIVNSKRKTPEKPNEYPTFTLADTLRGQIGPYRQVYNVTFYDIDIDVDIEEEYISGYVDIYFEALADFDTIQIDLYDNLGVNKVMFGVDSLTISRVYNAVFIAFNRTVKKGETGVVSVYYEGSPVKSMRPPWEGGFVWEEDDNKKPWIGVACELDGASLWWPLKDHLYDEPDSLQLSVTIPEGLYCVSNGKLIERRKEAEKETFIWKTSSSINTYNVTLYVGDYKYFTLPHVSNDTVYNLDFYVLPYNLEKAQEHFKQINDIITFFEDVYGEYPWWKDGYKLVESPYAGMEHQTAIAYGSDYKSHYKYGFDYILLHETAHEWWGNSVSVSDYAEIWIHEGFATYSEALYVEHTVGYDDYLSYLNYYSRLVKNAQPVIGPFDVNYWSKKDTDAYTKGALLLHSLRNLIDNDEMFFDIVKTFYTQYKYSIVTTDNFIDLVHAKTGENYDWFFQQYLYSRVCPQLEWNYVLDEQTSKYEIKYRWANVGNEFQMPVVLKSGEEIMVIYPNDELQTASFNAGVSSVNVNTNNSYISLKRNEKL